MKGDKLGDKATTATAAARKEIMKGDSSSLIGASGSQEQARKEIMKGDKGSPKGKSGSEANREGRQAWETRRQRQIHDHPAPGAFGNQETST